MIGSKWPVPDGKPKERFDPDEVTARVGLIPTSTGRLGDPLGNSPVPGSTARKQRIDHWSLRAGPREADDLNEVLGELHALLVTGWAQLVTACKADDLLVCVSCVVELRSTFTPATWITAPTLRWITELGADLDIDVLTFGMSPDNEGDPDAEMKPFL